MDLVPLAPPPSLPTLLGEMNASINDYELIAQKLMNESWIQFFQQLNADDVGRIMACVKWDQPRVALLLAPHLHQGRGMECADAAAAIQHALPQHRVVMVQRLLPVCVDAAHHHERVRDVLNDWEQTVTRDVWEPSTPSSSPPPQQLVLQKL